MTIFPNVNNFLQNRDIAGLSAFITEQNPQIEQKIEATLDSLSRISGSHHENAGVFISALKGTADGFLTNHFDKMKAVISLGEFKNNPHLRSLSEKVTYLAKNRFLNGYQDAFVCNTKFSHHLNKNLGNMPVMSKGAAYFLAGFTACISGLALSTLRPDLSATANKGAILGAAFLFSPIVDAFAKSFGDE